MGLYFVTGYDTQHKALYHDSWCPHLYDHAESALPSTPLSLLAGALTLKRSIHFRSLFELNLRFYGPVNPMGSCRALSVYLTTRFPGRLSPILKRLSNIVHILPPETSCAEIFGAKRPEPPEHSHSYF